MRAPRTILGLTLREHIGGRWAISLIAYGVNAPLNLFSVSANADAVGDSASISRWLLAWAISYLAMGAVVFLAHLTVFTHRRTHPMPIWSVVLLGAVAGGVRGFVIGAVAQAWQLAPADPGLVLTRVITGVVLGALLLPVVDLALSVISLYRNQRRVLVEEMRQIHAQEMRASGATQTIREALLDAVRVDLEALDETRDPRIARDVGRRMWASGEEITEPRLSWSAILVASVSRNPFPALPVAVIWCASAAAALVALLGPAGAALQLLWSAAVIAVTFWAGRRLRTRVPDVLLFVLVMLAVVVLTGPVASLIFDPRPWPAGSGLVIANTVWLPLLTILIGVVVAAIRSSEEVLDELRAQVTEEELALLASQSEHERVRRELATTLHGSVQTRLLAASALLQHGGVLPANFSAGLDEVLRAAGGEPTGGDLDEQLREITRQWSALMDVSVSLSGDVTGIPADAAARVIEDAVTNAFRHGQASQVVCTVDGRASDHVAITVVDNGTSPGGDGAPGLGSAILDAVAPGQWARASSPEGTTLSVRLGRGAPSM